MISALSRSLIDYPNNFDCERTIRGQDAARQAPIAENDDQTKFYRTGSFPFYDEKLARLTRAFLEVQGGRRFSFGR